jgi:REP element-mobilizing transposase RayT
MTALCNAGQVRTPVPTQANGMTFYRRNLPHLQRDGKPHFLTFCAYRRWMLPDWARSIVLDACKRANQWTIDLNAVVVMPDHVHMIFTPGINTQAAEVFSLTRITKAIKGSSAHLINRRLGRTGTVWQEESFDRVLRSSEKLDEKIAYVINNPVREGLTTSAAEYPWTWVADSEIGTAVPLRAIRQAGR